MLATNDNLTVFVAAFQLVFSAVVSITLWRLTAWQRRYEGLEGCPCRIVAFLDGGLIAVAGIVDEHVDGTEAVFRLPDRVRDLVVTVDIEREGERVVFMSLCQVLHPAGIA